MAVRFGPLHILALFCALTVSSATWASGIERRVVGAADATWHADYTNDSHVNQRILVRVSGSWSYQPRFACSAAGVPWTPDLRARSSQLTDPDCLPWSLLGRIQADDIERTFCASTDDHFLLPQGATLSFTINEFEGEHHDNSGALHLEVLALDITPETARPEIDDGQVLASE